MNRKRCKIGIALSLLLVLIGPGARAVAQETPQATLDRTLIEAIKAGDKQKALKALMDGASGEAKDTVETHLVPQDHKKPSGRKDVTAHLPALVLLYHLADQKATGDDRGSGPDLELVRALLDHGAKVNDTDVDGSTPLLIASTFSSSDAVRLLLMRGASVEQADMDGSTPIMFAEDPEVAKALLEQHASLKAVNHFGLNALMCAINHPDVARFLLGHGANVDAVDSQFKRTALIYATLSAKPEMVQVLLDHGAKVGAKDAAGRTALDYVRYHTDADSRKIAALLRKHGAK